MSLAEKGLIVNLRISQWSARKYDKKVTAEVDAKHNAKDAGRFNKSLLAREHLAEIQKIIGKARQFHYDNTYSWGDNGDRLLPSANYFDYMTGLNNIKTEFEQTVQAFLANYDHYINEARNQLGDLFDINEYPSDKEIALKFGLKFVPMPIPKDDFRVDLTEDEVEKIRATVETELKDRFNDTTKQAWKRVKDQLDRMKHVLSADKNESRVRESLFNDMEDLVNTLPKLNITGDPNISKICEEMKTLVVDADSVRNSDTLRKSKAQEVDDIMQKFSGFLS